MPSRLDYTRLLDEISRTFEAPDWESVREWLQRQGTSDRVRNDPYVPTHLSTLDTATFPPLQAGDIIASPILATAERFHIPTQCQVEAPVQVTGALHIERDVRAAEDMTSEQEIIWHGGTQSTVHNLIAPRIRLESPAGTVQGGIWCDSLAPDAGGTHLPPNVKIEGVVVVDKPDAAVVVGRDAAISGLVVEGSVRTEHGVSLSHVKARDSLQLGRNNHIGYAEAASIQADKETHIGVLISHGTVQLGAGCIIDSLRAEGDVVLDGAVTFTGQTVVTQNGIFRFPADSGWHSKREHWFYALPDQTLLPYRPDLPRPSESSLVALRSLTHQLWQQVNHVAGRTE